MENIKYDSLQFFAAVITVILIITGAIGGEEKEEKSEAHWNFNYKNMSEWVEHYKICAGAHQSPIDLTTGPKGDVQRMSYFPPLELKGYHQKPDAMNLTNNGHTVVVTVSQGMTASGGCVLDASFHFTQLHFHWGSNDSVGSEHRRNGHKFPIEFHFVHYNEKYPGLYEALDHPDGILVIAVWGDISNGTDNPALAPITESLKNIHEDNDITSAIGGPLHPLREILPNDADVYYHYQGSLTTPDCHESVTWIVFNETVPISKSQLEEFRKLHQGGHQKLPLVDNFRPLQPVNGRIVELVVSASNIIESSWIILFCYISLTLQILL